MLQDHIYLLSEYSSDYFLAIYAQIVHTLLNSLGFHFNSSHSLWLLLDANPPIDDYWMLCPVVFPGLVSLLFEDAMWGSLLEFVFLCIEYGKFFP